VPAARGHAAPVRVHEADHGECVIHVLAKIPEFGQPPKGGDANVVLPGRDTDT